MAKRSKRCASPLEKRPAKGLAFPLMGKGTRGRLAASVLRGWQALGLL